MPTAPSFDGQRLKALRQGRGLSRDDLAQRTGLAKRTVVSYEKNTRSPRADGLGLLALALDCQIDDLFSGGDR